MSLKKRVEEILDDQKRSLSWLATEMDKTFAGLRGSLTTESIKYSDLKKLVTILNVPIETLFAGDVTVQSIRGRYNTQLQSSTMNEPAAGYNKLEVEHLKEQVRLLKDQLADKDAIIELLRNK